MEGVPLKTPQAAVLQEVEDDISVTVPDYLNMLRKTEYEFSLENWVLTGLQNGFSNQHRPQPPSSSLGLLPSCPPYWMMFSSPQQSRLASRHSSDFWEPNPRQRSHSLNPAVLRTKFTIPDSDDEGEHPAQEAKPSAPVTASMGEARSSSQRKPQKAFVPDLLNPPSCLSSLPHQRRKNLRQCSLSGMDTSTQSNTEGRSQSPSSHRAPNIRANTVDTTMTDRYAAHAMHHRPDPCGNPPTPQRPRGLSSTLDSSTELLSALSPEERDLLGAITARGYPLRTAIIALQRMGQQTPDQVLSYLVACEHLCQLGHDMAQVEEALEMFQNCETKAEEFLHLLTQFHEMGFQKNAIKEVLLVHENHRERALEELMMRVA
ncbi:ubiquitin-associated protein 1-like [Melanotaenia boesemani]|uniref:ubiquitin-associated protein 1-like n=1 Tax=Melanotaenia boesemani TaxID=1250792 RepID=UPI001C055EA3|nr:ubiquitin-associated protein 1-like [Melanotaenia boesemani]